LAIDATSETISLNRICTFTSEISNVLQQAKQANVVTYSLGKRDAQLCLLAVRHRED